MLLLLKEFESQLVAIFIYWAGLVAAAIGILDVKLRSPNNRKSFLKLVGTRRPKLYVWIFHKVLPEVDRFFWANHSGRGVVIYGLKSWWRCNQISFIYPVYFTFIGWVFGNVATLGGIDAFYTGTPKEIRFIILLFVTAHMAGLMYFLEWRYYEKIAALILSSITSGERSIRSIKVKRATEELICAAAGMYFGCIFGIGTAAISPLVTYSQALFAGTAAGLIIGLVAGLIGGGPIAAIAGIILGSFIISDRVVICLIILFFGILPLVNGLFDYMSLCMTRFLVGRILIIRLRNAYFDFFRITFLILVDIAFSLFCIFLLTAALFITVVLYNKSSIVPVSAHVDWKTIVTDAYENPFGSGLPVTLILWSTFLPTAFNLILTSIIFIFRSWRKIALRLQKTIPSRGGADLSILVAVAGAASFLIFAPIVLLFRYLLVGTILFDFGITRIFYDLAVFLPTFWRF
jgi:hypothetical protein